MGQSLVDWERIPSFSLDTNVKRKHFQISVQTVKIASWRETLHLFPRTHVDFEDYLLWYGAGPYHDHLAYYA